MLDKATLDRLVDQIVSQLEQRETAYGAATRHEAAPTGADGLVDITSPREKAVPLLENPEDYDALMRMKGKTNARIGVGRCGPRLNTRTLLTLRADHSVARDAVFTDVSPEFLDKNGIFTVQTKCTDKNMHITRPDLGRQLSDEAKSTIKSKCKPGVDVQLIVSDGLSSKAVESNAGNALPVIIEGLRAKGITVGDPFFIKYGRVAVQDEVCQLLGCKVVCILVGERPGLATAESMSAYICYNAKVGQPEARRTVVSNIHSGGVAAVEAGAYITDLIEKILAAKASGVELVGR